ncbi:MAG: N-acetylglucosamine-6-phosphate deacetylase [Chitinophagales bacterium]
MSERWIMTNARVVTPHRILPCGYVEVAEGRIVAIGHQGDLATGGGVPAGARVIDAGGRVAAPGFLDLHVHGGGGADLMDATSEAVKQMGEAHAKGGTTGFLATTLTSSDADLQATLRAFRQAKRETETPGSGYRGAKLLGLHLEGPYFALTQKGAQDPRYVKNPDPAQYLAILDEYPEVRRWSAAPELPGAGAFAAELRRRGVLASMAHTDADYDTAVRALEAGFTHLTHFYSAMSMVRRVNCYRVPGVVEAGYLLDGLTVEVIADGHHLPAPLLRLVHKVKGPDRVALVTDAMRAAGMPEGEYLLGGLRDGQPVLSEGGVGWLPDKTSFASSVVTFNVLLRTMVTLAGVPLADAVKMASTTPARLIGLTGKGVLAEGFDADLVLLNDDFTVALTAVEGRIVHQAM